MAEPSENTEPPALAGKGPQAQRAIIYIEVLASLVILAFAVVSVAPLLIVGAERNASASDMTYTATLAEEKAEELSAADFATLTAGSFSDRLRFGNIEFERTWVITDDSPQPAMKLITITVESQRIRTLGEAKTATVRLFRAN